MLIKIVHDAGQVYEFLKSKPRYDYIYQFSNLSAEQWKNVICFGLFQGTELMDIAMLNINYDIPVLLAATFNGYQYNVELLKQLKKFLPHKFYTHINNLTLKEVFSQDTISEAAQYMNMGICASDVMPKQILSTGAVRLGYENLNDIKELISLSYPEAWLDDDLVKLKENFGVYADGKLVSFAGIHAYSGEYGVAAVAHVTTHPAYRRKGYAAAAVASLTNSLCEKIEFIGLNVKVDNIKAVNCYKKLGFKEFGSFTACEIEQR